MERRLYRVKVETELMVMAINKREAEEVAKKNVVNEISIYGEYSSNIVKSISDIPQNWKDVIPYSSETIIQEKRKCADIFVDDYGADDGSEDLEELVKIQKKSKASILLDHNRENEVVPETRPDPTPRELDWRETKSGRPMPPLRFNIPEKK